jgi:hypothetical protein
MPVICGRMTAHPKVETDRRGGATSVLPGEMEAGGDAIVLRDSLVGSPKR